MLIVYWFLLMFIHYYSVLHMFIVWRCVYFICLEATHQSHQTDLVRDMSSQQAEQEETTHQSQQAELDRDVTMLSDGPSNDAQRTYERKRTAHPSQLVRRARPHKHARQSSILGAFSSEGAGSKSTSMVKTHVAMRPPPSEKRPLALQVPFMTL